MDDWILRRCGSLCFCLVLLRLTVAGSVDLRIYQSRWFHDDGHPTGGQGGPMATDNPWVGLVAVAVTFQGDFESKCACPKFLQESQTKPPLSNIYSMFRKDTFIFTLIHAKKIVAKRKHVLVLCHLFIHTTFLEDHISPPPNIHFCFQKKNYHPTTTTLSSPFSVASIPPPTSPGPPEWRLPRLRHEFLSSAAPAARAVRVHRGTPGVVDAAAAGEGYGGRSGQGGQGKGQGGMWWVEVGGLVGWCEGIWISVSGEIY